MRAISREPLRLNEREVEIVGEVLESERCRLLGEMRHTAERPRHEELRQRLGTVDRIMERCHAAISAE